MIQNRNLKRCLPHLVSALIQADENKRALFPGISDQLPCPLLLPAEPERLDDSGHSHLPAFIQRLQRLLPAIQPSSDWRPPGLGASLLNKYLSEVGWNTDDPLLI